MKGRTGFIVSARKYRPDTFDTVVGQRSTSATLKNAIRTEHLAQAYLFCGPRGVGKTTCARIFAKTINCSNLSSEIEACNTCESCQSFNQNRSFNIHELDAASNNSVEDIRVLIEKVRIPPQVGKYSVYIIDEVHMLSQSAFNAFLKTLEEPPKHAIFIMATTEKHKILPTILSRCQIFDFNRIKVTDIVTYLESIAEKEKVNYETEALNIIAQKADGSMRDALSVFDQLSSFTDNQISYQQVIEILNVLDYEYYFRLTDNFLKGMVTETLLVFDEILARGFDAHNFINGMSKHFRNLLVCKAEKTMQLLEVGESIKTRYLEQSTHCSDEFIFSCLDICNSCDVSYKSSSNQRLHVELTLIKLCNQSQKKNNLEEDDILVLSDSGVEYNVEKKKNTTSEMLSGALQDQLSEKVVSVNEHKSLRSETPSIKQALGSLNGNGESNPIENHEGNNDMEPNHEEEPQHEVQSLTGKDLENLWLAGIESLKNESSRMYNALKTQNVKVDTNVTAIKLVFRNNALISEFKNNYKSGLLAFLRKNIHNNSLEIQEELLKEEVTNSAKYYTDLDKLRYMIEKNPAMKKLKKDFNLDIQ